MTEIQQILLEANTAASRYRTVGCKLNLLFIAGGSISLIIGCFIGTVVQLLGLVFLLIGAGLIGYTVWKSLKDQREQNAENNVKKAKVVQAVLDRLNCSAFYNSDFTTTVDAAGEYILVEVSHVMGGGLPNQTRYPNPQTVLNASQARLKGGRGSGMAMISSQRVGVHQHPPGVIIRPKIPHGYANPGMGVRPGMNQAVGGIPMGAHGSGQMTRRMQPQHGMGAHPAPVMNNGAYPGPPTGSMLNQSAQGIHGPGFNQIHPRPQGF